MDAVQKIASVAVNGSPRQILALFGLGLRPSIAFVSTVATLVKVIVGVLDILGAIPLFHRSPSRRRW